MSKKLEEKQRKRLEEQRRREAQRKQARKGNLVTIGVALAVIGLIAAAVLLQGDEAESVGVAADEANCTDIETFEPDPEPQHVADGTPVQYEQSPPTSGDHYETPATAGFSTAPLPPEVVVHNLEHGQVVFWYSDRDEDVVNDLEDIVDQQAAESVAVPYEDIDPPYNFVMTAWGASQSCELVSQDVVDKFRTRFQGRGPERIPGIEPFDG